MNATTKLDIRGHNWCPIHGNRESVQLSLIINMSIAPVGPGEGFPAS